MRIRPKDIPAVKARISKQQGAKCALCLQPFSAAEDKDCVLDHDHKTGRIRSALCRNCNGIEGKIYNLANRAKRTMTVQEWLERLLKYYKYHETDRHGLIHPTHKTLAEKKIEKAKSAKLMRAKKKALSTLKGKK